MGQAQSVERSVGWARSATGPSEEVGEARATRGAGERVWRSSPAGPVNEHDDARDSGDEALAAMQGRKRRDSGAAGSSADGVELEELGASGAGAEEAETPWQGNGSSGGELGGKV